MQIISFRLPEANKVLLQFSYKAEAGMARLIGNYRISHIMITESSIIVQNAVCYFKPASTLKSWFYFSCIFASSLSTGQGKPQICLCPGGVLILLQNCHHAHVKENTMEHTISSRSFGQYFDLSQCHSFGLMKVYSVDRQRLAMAEKEG